MLNIGPQELLLILVIALIVVGPTRLPELGRSIGKGLREIRKAQDEVKRTIQVNLDEPTAGTRAPSGSDGRGAVTEGSAPATGDEPSGRTPERVPAAVEPERAPLATDPPPESEVTEISRTLGRSLAELRRAREEVQRSFRFDLTPSPPERSPTPSARPAPEPTSEQPSSEPGTPSEPPPD